MMDYKYTDRGKEHGGEGAMGGGCAQGCGSQLLHLSGSAWMGKTGVVWAVWWCRRVSDQRQAQVDGRLITGRLDALPPACHSPVNLCIPRLSLARDPCTPCFLLSREIFNISMCSMSLLSHTRSCRSSYLICALYVTNAF